MAKFPNVTSVCACRWHAPAVGRNRFDAGAGIEALEKRETGR